MRTVKLNYSERTLITSNLQRGNLRYGLRLSKLGLVERDAPGPISGLQLSWKGRLLKTALEGLMLPDPFTEPRCFPFRDWNVVLLPKDWPRGAPYTPPPKDTSTMSGQELEVMSILETLAFGRLSREELRGLAKRLVLALAPARPTPAAMDSFLSAKDLTALRGFAYNLFAELSSDLLTALREEGRTTVTREEALEVVIDANRLEDYLRRSKRPDLSTYVRGVLDGPEGYDRMCTLLKPAFKFKTYA